MKISKSFLRLISLPVAAASVFSIHPGPVGHVRTDPIVNPTCLSDHVHTFYGPKALWPSTTWQTLRNVDPLESSGSVVENQSLYWHPSIYRVLTNGTHELVDNSFLSIYYVWTPGQTTAFPPNFQMIAGIDPAFPEVGTEFFCEGGSLPCNPANGNNCSPNGRPNTEFPLAGCDEMLIFIRFPSCWDNVNRDTCKFLAKTNDLWDTVPNKSHTPHQPTTTVMSLTQTMTTSVLHPTPFVSPKSAFSLKFSIILVDITSLPMERRNCILTISTAGIKAFCRMFWTTATMENLVSLVVSVVLTSSNPNSVCSIWIPKQPSNIPRSIFSPRRPFLPKKSTTSQLHPEASATVP